VEVRQAGAADWALLRELRLRALADAPDAFASTLDQEAVFPEEVWRQRAEGGPASANFIAREAAPVSAWPRSSPSRASPGACIL